VRERDIEERKAKHARRKVEKKREKIKSIFPHAQAEKLI